MTTILRKNATCQIPTCNAVLCQHHLRRIDPSRFLFSERYCQVCAPSTAVLRSLVRGYQVCFHRRLCSYVSCLKPVAFLTSHTGGSWCRHVFPNVGPLRSNVECRRVSAFRPRHLSYIAQFSLYSCQLPQVHCPCKITSL